MRRDNGGGGGDLRLRRKQLEHVAVRVPEVHPSPAAPVVDRHVLQGVRPAAVPQALSANAVEYGVELRLADLEGVKPRL